MKLLAKLKNPDVLGWVIWTALTLLLIGPCTYLFFLITYDDTTTTLTRVIAGVFSAAVLSGVLSWLGNEVWFWFRRRQTAEKRKAMRKAKRRKK